eukprot:scaffold7335_cov162-Skeletonema_dohrnii-CCMP3373.AAC.3
MQDVIVLHRYCRKNVKQSPSWGVGVILTGGASHSTTLNDRSNEPLIDFIGQMREKISGIDVKSLD